MERARPVLDSPPVGLTDVRLKSLKRRVRSLSGMPGPWSRTGREQWVAFISVCTVMVEPGGENLIALPSRLFSTCRIFGSSIDSSPGIGPGCQTMKEPFSAAVALFNLTEAAIRPATDVGRGV